MILRTLLFLSHLATRHRAEQKRLASRPSLRWQVNSFPQFSHFFFISYPRSYSLLRVDRRKLALLFALASIFATPSLFAQGVSYTGTPIALTRGGFPAAGAAVVVCSGNVAVTLTANPPCAPYASIFSDPLLTAPIAQPGFKTDGLGNYPFFAAGGATYTIVIPTQGGFTGSSVVWNSPIIASSNASLSVVNAGNFTVFSSYLQSLINSCNPSVEIGTNTPATQAIVGCIAVPVGAVNNNSAAIAGFASASADSASRTHGNAVGGYFQGRCLVNNSACWAKNGLSSDAPGITGHNITGNELDIGVNAGSTPAYVRGIAIIAAGTGTPGTNSIGIELAAPPSTWQWNTAFRVQRGISANGIILDGNGFGGGNGSQPINFIGYDGGNVARQSSVSGNSTGSVQLQPSSGGGYFALVSAGGFQIPGSSSGASIVVAPATGGGTNTLPPGSGTLLQTGSGANNLLQTKRVAGCATAAPINSTCDTTITWTNAFPDANYTAHCDGDVVTSGVPIVEGIDISAAKTGAAVTVRTLAITAAAAQFTTIDCSAIHD